MMFFTIIVLSTLISISSYSWLGMWLGLEINLLSIIPLMQNQKNILSTESSIKYFIVQAIASTIILASIIVMMISKNIPMNLEISNLTILTMNSALLTKMGMAPFHFWFPEVMEGLNWMNCLLILTWQKITPMVLLMYNMKFIMFLTMIIVLSMIISGIMGVNQVSLRKILTYSSINHMGWMISTMIIFQTIWMSYFMIYTIISINLVLILKTFNVFFLNQLYQSLNNNIMPKLFFIMNFLSLSGIPPFLGFMPKWLTIQALLFKNMVFLPTVMIIFTIIMIFMYIRITISTLLMNVNEMNWKETLNLMKFKSMTMSLMNFLTISSLIMVTILFNML
uniref:NADH-ubiquinone oxidoreductase chain 2 n=1 Tax=Athous haemorrhoidalis TaxID=195169 RepID=A0A191ZR14_9COLE|nr:NADH dehydrogenase subunit 2 [Athous haemorrhoidalis]